MTDFENLLNEFEHACRGGDYEISEQLKNQIVERLEEAERHERAIEEILYHYPTPIDEELDYEKAYSEVKEIAKQALGVNGQ